MPKETVHFKFDQEKAIAALLLLAKALIKAGRQPGAHKIFKILYFADQKHLIKYGRPILGDRYIAMQNGPVPSSTYDIFKIVRGDSFFWCNLNFDQYFDVSGHLINPKQDPDLDQFSESDLECLGESLKENRHLSFAQLKRKSHDGAWEKANVNDEMSYWDIAEVGGAVEAILELMQVQFENEIVLDA